MRPIIVMYVFNAQNLRQISYNFHVTGDIIITSISEPDNMKLSKLKEKLEKNEVLMRDFEK